MFAIDQPYTLALIASVIISISMAVAVLMHKHTLGVHAFATLNGAIGLWAFASLFEVCSLDLQSKIFFYGLKYLFIVIVPPAWFVFGLYYSNRLRKLRFSRLIMLSIVPAVTLALVATNRYHNLMFTSLQFIKTTAYVFLYRNFGTWFWIHATYCYILLSLGFLFMAKQFIDSPSPYRWQVATLIIGGLVPCAANIAFTYKLTPFYYLDLTPFAFTISGIAFMWGIMRFQLLDVAPIAHEVVIQHIEDAILVLDGEQRILNLNPAAKALIDLSPINPIGARADKVISWWSKINTCILESGIGEPPVIDLSDSGRRRLLRMKTVPFFCNQRKMGQLITLTDVTDAFLAKEALRNSERRFRSLSENAPVIIFALDTDGAVTYLNPAWEKILGHKRNDLIGQPFVDQVTDKNEWIRADAIAQLIAGHKTVVDLNIAIQDKIGNPRLFNTSVAANTDTEGRVTGIIGLAKDITEERKLQRQLFQSQKMEAIGTLAGGVAHDFNNLLMGMQANLSLMRLDQDPAKPSDDKIQRIENQIQSGAALTRQLLGYARKGQYVVAAVNIDRLIEETLSVVQRTNKNITVQSLLGNEPSFVKADRGQIEMVLLNLFLNAVDAMPNGGRLTAACRPVAGCDKTADAESEPSSRGFVEIVVSDTGMGMDPATQERIFEPFFTTKEVGRGSGLGLASVYGVVHNHGGHIHVNSAPGRGATFTLYLPASDETPPETPLAAPPKLVGDANILLVEDEDLIRKYTEEMMRSLNFRVMAAANGDEAIQIYRNHCAATDLVLLDMIMPGMDGYGVFKILEEINPQVKVIITSGYTVDQRIDQILSSGPHGYLKKPYTLDELAEEISKTLDRSHPNGNTTISSSLKAGTI
jgi:two-component system, cell cycle sensor histidine kinase and response regulator CckA